jgi:photosystem II stability/assembly factor-like uncharacterized protein
MANLEKLYAEVQQEIKAQHLDRASELLKQILIQDENYMDSSRLLAQIIQRKRRRWYNNPLIFIILGCVTLAISGVIFLPKLIGVFQSRSKPTQQISTPISPLSSSTMILSTPTSTPNATPLPYHWVRINGGQEFPREAITALMVDPKDPDLIYAGTLSAGIYRTINGGESWQPANSGIETGSVNKFLINAQNPKTLYAITHAGLYKTTNGAEKWKQIANTNVVAMDPANGDHLFMSLDGIISESLDGGEVWTNKSDKNINYNFHYLSVDWKDPNKLYALGKSSVDNGEGFFSSTDGGVTWTYLKEFSGMEAVVSTILPSGDTGILIEATDDLGSTGLFLSADGGNTWTNKNRWCWTISETSIPSAIFCNSGNDFNRSVNGGETWVTINPPAFILTNSVYAIAFSGGKNPTLYVAGANGIIYRSTDLGDDFEPMVGNGLGSTVLTLSISPSNNNIFILAQRKCFMAWPISMCNNYLSTDNGVTWNLLPQSFLEFFAWNAEGTSLYGIKSSPGGITLSLMVSNDFGKNWLRVSTIPGPDPGLNGGTQIDWFVVSHTQPGTLFIYRTGAVPALLRSIDGGLTWEQLNFKVGGNQRFNITGNFLWAENDGNLLYSDDNGSTFHNCNYQDLGPSQTFALVYSQKTNLILWGNTKDGIVQSSANDCQTWSPLPSQPETLVINTMVSDPNDENTLFVGSNIGAFVSLDMGKSWSVINDGLLGANIIYSMVVDSQGNVFASTPYGIFKLVYK